MREKLKNLEAMVCVEDEEPNKARGAYQEPHGSVTVSLIVLLQHIELDMVVGLLAGVGKKTHLSCCSKEKHFLVLVSPQCSQEWPSVQDRYHTPLVTLPCSSVHFGFVPTLRSILWVTKNSMAGTFPPPSFQELF